jgi:hypothetical protein
MRIGLSAEQRTVAAKELCFGQQLGMHFQAYYRFIFFKIIHRFSCSASVIKQKRKDRLFCSLRFA